jgi:hypothetical protein
MIYVTLNNSDLAPYLSLPKDIAPSRRDHIIGVIHEIRLNHIQVGRLMAANAVCLVNLGDEFLPSDVINLSPALPSNDGAECDGVDNH